MTKRVTELRRQVEATEKNGRGRRRYARELRTEVVELAAAWKAAGRARVELARQLGVEDRTLAGWVHRAGGVVPVRVIADARDRGLRSMAATPTITVVSPSGYRVEGLTVGDAATLLRELS